MRKLLLLMALALASCAAQRPCIPIVDTVEIPTNQHLRLDSVWVYQHDSVSVTMHTAPSVGFPLKGQPIDTLFIERWHTRYKDKLVQSTDTIYQIKPVEIVREVKHVPKFYKVCAWVLAGVVLLGVGKIAWKIAMTMR